MLSESKIFAPVHPGEILKEEFIDPMGISQYRLAKDTRMSPTRIGQIVNGKRSITAQTALRLSKFFGNSAEFWLGLQMQYDLECAEDSYGAEIEQQVVHA